jgi:putative transposase
MNYYQLIDKIEPIFVEIINVRKLACKAKTGRPRVNICRIFRGIMKMLIKGTTWRDFDKKYGTRSTAHRYFSEWAAAGVFREIWLVIVKILTADKLCNLRIQIIDASDKPVKNMLKKFTSIGYKYKNKFAIKITILMTKSGIPIGLDICDAAKNDSKRLQPVLENSIVDESEMPPSTKLLADKGYYGNPCIEIAAQHNRIFLTPQKSNSKIKNSDRVNKLLKKRSAVERFFARFYQFRRIDKIFDKNLINYTGWCCLGLALISIFHIK